MYQVTTNNYDSPRYSTKSENHAQAITRVVFPVEIGKYQDCSKKVEISPRSLYHILASRVQEKVTEI